MTQDVVGRVSEIWRYPVKSMAGESLARADVSWQGLEGDRRWAFIRPGIPRSGFSWLTIRQQPRMWHYHPSFADPGDPNRSPTIVRTPDGRELDVADPDLAAELGDDLRVIKQDRGIFDSLPLSLITTRSIADLEALHIRLPIKRVCPSFGGIIEGADNVELLFRSTATALRQLASASSGM